MKNAVLNVAVVSLSVAFFADLCGAEGLSIGLNFVVARETTDNASGPCVSERAGATDLSDLRAGTFHAWLISSGSSNPWTGNLTGTLPASELIAPGGGETGAGGLIVTPPPPRSILPRTASRGATCVITLGSTFFSLPLPRFSSSPLSGSSFPPSSLPATFRQKEV